MTYFLVDPEVAGGIGDDTVIDRRPGAEPFVKLHYEFEGWPDDGLIACMWGAFVVTKPLAEALRAAALTGIAFDVVKVSISDEYAELFPRRKLPGFEWLKIAGHPGKDDFGLAPGFNLVISERAYDVMKPFGLQHALIKPFKSG